MNILIKLMSIVSLVIAPTLASMYGGAAPKHVMQEMKKEISMIKTDSTNTTNLTVTADGDALKVPSDKLIEALIADKLIDKDNFSVKIIKGKLILDDKEVAAETLTKYQPLIDAFGGADFKITQAQK